MVLRTTVTLVFAVLVGATPVVAQRAQSRDGFWLSVGGGGGWNDGMRGASGYLRMGGTPDEWVQFGAQVLRWWRIDDYEVFGRTSVTATAQVFPLHSNAGKRLPLQNWHVRTAFGIANVDHHMQGVALNVGTGIDLEMDGRFFVTPSVDVLLQLYRHHTESALLFTMGLTWH